MIVSDYDFRRNHILIMYLIIIWRLIPILEKWIFEDFRRTFYDAVINSNDSYQWSYEYINIKAKELTLTLVTFWNQNELMNPFRQRGSWPHIIVNLPDYGRWLCWRSNFSNYLVYDCLQLRTAYFFPVAISKPSWIINCLVYYGNKLRFW